MRFDGWTLLLQAINFGILVFLLHRFLYRPLLRMIDVRQQATQQALSDAEAREQEAERARAAYEARQQEITGERDRAVDAARAEVDRERAAMLDEARSRARAELADARARIARETEAAGQAMVDDAAALAGDLAHKLVAGVATATVADALLASALGRLEQLPPDQRQRLRDDLAGGALTVATCPELDAAQQQGCRARIAAGLGAEAPVEFVADPELGLGAELRFPHASVGYSWRDTLAAAVAELKSHERAG